MQPSAMRRCALHKRAPVLPVLPPQQLQQLHHTAAVAQPALASRRCPDVSRVCCSSTAPATGAGPAAVSPPPSASTATNSGGSETPSTAAPTSNATSSSSSSSANGASTSGSGGTASASDPVPVSYRKEAKLTAEQYKEIYDRLIKIFKERPRDDWKKLIVFSKQWGEHYQGVFDRIKEVADAEKDLDKKMAMRSLFRAVQSVHEEVKRYNSILEKFASAGDDEWDAIVAVYRGDLQRPFFEHMQCLLAAAKDDKERLDTLVMMNTRLVALCTSYDSIEANPDKLQQAAEVYRDLLSSITSVEDIDKKMSELASAGKIDPAFLQISAKAYGAARDTNMTLEEAKWVSYKMYRSAKDMFDRQQPAEKRIIEYLLTIPDPQERRNQLDKAVTPGPTRFTDTHDYMWSTPQRLYLVLDSTLRAYTEMRNEARGKLGTSDASIMPRKVRIMAELRDELIKRYL